MRLLLEHLVQRWLILLAAVLSLALPAQAAYPEKPIKIIVAFAPGSSTDIVARLLGEQHSALLGQPVIVENKPGAGGNIATVGVMDAPADGYTLLMHSVAYSVNPTLFANAGYEALNDLQPLALTALTPNLLYVHPDVKANNLAGKGRPIAVTSLKRSPALPDVPTLAELGYKDFEAYTWFALLAPGKTPSAVLDMLNARASKALMVKFLQDRSTTLSLESTSMNWPVVRCDIESEVGKWSRLVKELNIMVEQAAQIPSV